MTTITRAQAEAAGACASGLKFLGNGKTIAEICEQSTTWGIWCLRLLHSPERIQRLFTVWCASRVLHLTADPRPAEAVAVAERYAWGEASQEELAAARAAASEAHAAAHVDTSCAAYAARATCYAGTSCDAFASASFYIAELEAQKAEILRIFAAVERGEEPYQKPNWGKYQ